MAALVTLLRFFLMCATAELSLCLFGAGFDQKGLMFVGWSVAYIATIPVAIFTAVMMLIEAMVGRRGGFYVSLFGLLPTIIVIFLSALYGAGRQGWHYAYAVAFGGVVWGAMWLLTSKLKPKPSLDAPLEHE